MSVKVLHVLIFVLTSSLFLEAETRHRRAADSCGECPAGKYMVSCNKCSPCPDNTFTNESNTEYSCLSCFRDCRAELHMQVVSPCSKVSDVVCECMNGFVCIKTDEITEQCVRCKKQAPVSIFFPTVAQTASYTPAQTTLPPPAWTSRMLFSTMSPLTGTQGTNLLFCILFLVLCVLFSIFIYYFYKRRKIDCIKKRLKQCSVRKKKEDSKATSPEINKPIKQLHAQETHTQTPTSPNTDYCPTSQPASREQPLPGSGNLGPLHIYGAGTVFVSLLNQFGLNGGDKDEEDLRQQPLNNSEMHVPPSPTIPLSKEEGNRDISYISFPSQEQGKECHMSKEEGL